jgi:hypothetical protein
MQAYLAIIICFHFQVRRFCNHRFSRKKLDLPHEDGYIAGYRINFSFFLSARQAAMNTVPAGGKLLLRRGRWRL